VHPVYALTAIVVSLIIFIPAIRKALSHLETLLLVMDSIGLAIFTVTGVGAGMAYNNLFLTVFVGTVTGVGGGVLRDLFAGNRPYIFVKHFYACASIIGSLISAFLWDVNELLAMIAGMSAIFILRILAAIFKWSLPKA